MVQGEVSYFESSLISGRSSCLLQTTLKGKCLKQFVGITSQATKPMRHKTVPEIGKGQKPCMSVEGGSRLMVIYLEISDKLTKGN